MHEFKKNPELYYACKLLSSKDHREYKRLIKVKDMYGYATDGIACIKFPLTLEDGYYIPVKVTKTKIQIAKYAPLEKFPYPECDRIFNITDYSYKEVDLPNEGSESIVLFTYDVLNNAVQPINFKYIQSMEGVLDHHKYIVQVYEENKRPYIFQFKDTTIAIMGMAV